MTIKQKLKIGLKNSDVKKSKKVCIGIDLPKKDLVKLKKTASEQGVSSLTLIENIMHDYVRGTLIEALK